MHGAESKLNHTINVTPLADVMLVLLIIFMVITPYLFEGVPVAVPAADHPTEHPDGKGTLVISLKDDGTLYLGTDDVTEAELTSRLVSELESRTDKTLYLKADANLEYGDVLALMDACRRAGAVQMALITRRRPQSAEM